MGMNEQTQEDVRNVLRFLLDNAGRYMKDEVDEKALHESIKRLGL